MHKFVLAIVILPILLILTLPASHMLMNEFRLWLFARQLAELDGLFERDFRVSATGSELHQSGNSEYCSFTATRLYSHNESEENLEKIKKSINSKNFNAARETEDTSPIDHHVYFSNGYLAVTLSDGPYDAWFDVRCW